MQVKYNHHQLLSNHSIHTESECPPSGNQLFLANSQLEIRF